MILLKTKFKYYLLPLLSGVLIGTSYIPFPPWAVFFCYIPLWLFCLKQTKLKYILIGTWLCQFVFNLIGFNWVAYTIMKFGFFSWPISLFGLMGFASFANLHIVIALFIWFILQKKLPKNSLITFILLPVCCALSVEYYPQIFDWHFGYTWFYAHWPAAQTAEIWGFKFLNTVTLFFNVLLLYVFININKNFLNIKKTNTTKLKFITTTANLFFTHHKKNILILSAGILFFISLNIYGQYLKNNWPKADKIAHALLVQPPTQNMSILYKKTKKDPRPFMLSQLINTTQKYFTQNLLRPDFIIWSESLYPYSIKYNNTKIYDNTIIKTLAKKWKSPIILSAIGQTKNQTTNSVFTVNKKGNLVQPPYNKIMLLAFGEYLPGETWLPIYKLLPYYNGSFTRGTSENNILKLNNVNLGFQICYEGLFDYLSIDLAQKKAQIIINVTNDSWYGTWQQPLQHLYMTLARSIEIRRPIIRGTKTGYSAFVSAKGEISKLTSLKKRGSWIQKITYYSNIKNTIFTSWGYYINQYFLWILFILILCFIQINTYKYKLISLFHKTN